jgi:hypothetical protein
VLAEVKNALHTSVNPDGGWGYFPGKAIRLEPTCWALLALLDAGTQAPKDVRRETTALALLAARQGQQGLLVDVPGAPPNFAFNGLAAIVISRAVSLGILKAPTTRLDLRALVAAIVAAEGVRFGGSGINRQNNVLAAWPWHEGTSNWVEPTAWCLSAVKKTATPVTDSTAAARLSEGDRMLADRCCSPGGWNDGNSNMLGKELSPYVLNSALGLLALQARRALPEVARSIDWLTANWHTEPSASAVSLAMVAMEVFGRPTGDLERALHAYLAGVGRPDNLAASGMTLYVLNGSHHGYAAFTV